MQGLHACQTRAASAERGGAAPEAVKGKKALHSARQPPPHNVRQLSAKAASDYLPFVRADRHKGPVAAVVDFVIAGHRLKARRAAAARHAKGAGPIVRHSTVVRMLLLSAVRVSCGGHPSAVGMACSLCTAASEHAVTTCVPHAPCTRAAQELGSRAAAAVRLAGRA